MTFNFNFKTETVTKKNLMNWLIEKLTSNGWEYLSHGRSQDDYVFSSKGENGNDNIMFQLREYYGSYPARSLTSTYQYIGVKVIHAYIPHSNPTGIGQVSPTDVFHESRFIAVDSSTLEPDADIEVSYHVNKDRIIIITHTPIHITNSASSLTLLGKPLTLTKYDEYSACAVITTHGYSNGGACISGIYGKDTKNLRFVSQFKHDIPTVNSKNNNTFSSELLVGNDSEGFKYVVENVLVGTIKTNEKMDYSPLQRLNRLITEDGGIYMPCPVGYTSGLNDTLIKCLFIKVGDLE